MEYSVKQELLYQNGILNEEIILKLYPARKARNKLVHEGKSVPQEVAVDLYIAVKLLLEKASGIDNLNLVDVIDHEDSWDRETPNFDVEYFRTWGTEKKINYTPHEAIIYGRCVVDGYFIAFTIFILGG